MNTTSVAQGQASYSAEDWQRLAAALDDGIICYDLRPIEVLLLLVLKAETYRRQSLSAPVRLEAWAAQLGMEVRKLRPYWRELVLLGIVDANQGQGSYSLRPDAAMWSKTRGRRSAASIPGHPELPLIAERPLDAALTEVAVEKVLSPKSNVQSRTVTAEDWHALRESLSCPEKLGGPPSPGYGAVKAAEKSAGAGAEKFSGGGGKIRRGAAEKSAGPQVADTGPPGELFTVFTDPYSLAEAQPLKAEAELSFKAAEKSAGAVIADSRLPIAEGQRAGTMADGKGQMANRQQRIAAAMDWLQRVDSRRRLARVDVLSQWEDLCQREPEYVLGKLRRRYEEPHNAPLSNPLGWLAQVAIEDGRLRRLGRVRGKS